MLKVFKIEKQIKKMFVCNVTQNKMFRVKSHDIIIIEKFLCRTVPTKKLNNYHKLRQNSDVMFYVKNTCESIKMTK